ncbi:MAG: 23S rRNA (guanosine(2251)-2'-O)-methyltransferase RlmB [Clostridia bacterium]|nr:23S rRNA (guanosine(2251)-2'-O)-methyltransferase RlmB [Clostridia bacterium]MDD4665575.1 23S rRNA (guanosine(2251)-2'-O)-methyltransferase RlmB [Clostridia bacterium]
MDDVEFIAGKNPVLEALQAGRPLSKILLAQGLKQSSVKEIMSLARTRQIPYQFVARERLDSLVPGNIHQGIVAQAGAKEYVDWEEIVEKALQKGTDPFLVLLDGLEDPRNLGAILRTAEAVGVDGVIIPKHRSVSLTAAVARSSAGAVEYVPVARVPNLPLIMDRLKEKGYWIVGTDSQAEQKYFEADLKGPLAVVLGSEGKGLGKLVKEKCDFLVSIPMLGQVNSLNVSVAGALLFYEIIRQRGLV